MYIPHLTNEAGARPAPTYNTNTGPDSHGESRRAPGRGGQRGTGKPPPSKENKNITTRKVGNPHPATNVHPPANRKEGKKGETDTQSPSHTPTAQEAGNPPSQATLKATPTGPPKEHRGTSLPNLVTPSQKQPPFTTTRPPKGWRKGHPGHATAQATGEVAGHRPHRSKKKGKTQTKAGGGAETKGSKTGTGNGNHHKAATQQGREPHQQTPPAAR